MGVLFFLLNLIWGITIPLAIQLADRRRMTPEQREWVWSFATWGSALYNFGPLSLLAWGYVTRSPHYVRGLAAGLAMTIAALLCQGLLLEAVGRLVGMRALDLSDNRVAVGATMAAAALLALIVGAGRAVYEAVRGARG